MSKIILIAGGTGLIGKRLTQLLSQKGYQVRVLTRTLSPAQRNTHFVWDVDNAYIDENAFQDVSIIINLAGSNIGSNRWTQQRKKDIIDSRVKSTALLFHYVEQKNLKIEKFITSSAIGYYGAITTHKIFTEFDSPANDFLSKVCQLWENAADVFHQKHIKTVKIRTGIVLDVEEGALPKMIKPIKMGFGAVLGNGKQYMPWIHLDDICNVYLWSVQNEQVEGIYNAVAPQHVDNEFFTKILAQVLGKKLIMPQVPKWFLKMVLGEMSVIVTEGSRVSSDKIQAQGFAFRYTDLEQTLQQLLHKK